MSLELKIPQVGESIHEVEIGRWLKSEGQWVEKDENLVEIETDKASVELPAPASGYLAKIIKFDGEPAEVGDVIAQIEEADAPAEGPSSQPKEEGSKSDSAPEIEPPHEQPAKAAESGNASPAGNSSDVHATPSGRRALREHGLAAGEVDPGEDRRLTEDDVIRHISGRKSPAAAETPRKEAPTPSAKPAPRPLAGSEAEEAVPMSIVRRSIARRLVEAQQQAALLTTFNEVDMTEIKTLRAQHGEAFLKKYGVKLGYMGFFVKAVVDALRGQPEVNARIQDRDIIYHNYYHIGIAIGGERGLVVPILRNAERLSFAEIEQAIADFAGRASENKITPDELTGGTFTISNGGVYGSLLSTPIVNPPQSAVLGMHTIQDRPVALNGEVVIRPMMYLALTYDHRLVDGREAVTFLRRITEALEEPARMLIEV
jgi:2-oxoglutarate dehydrogenase E2 component (dihydrolipoamide succinyltransferase)